MRTLSLRSALILTAGGVALVVTAAAVFTMASVIPPIARQTATGETFDHLYGAVESRMALLDSAWSVVQGGRTAEMEPLRARLTTAWPRTLSMSYADVPPGFDVVLAESDRVTSRLRHALLEGIALRALGRTETAAAIPADSLLREAARQNAALQHMTFTFFSQRAARVADAARRAGQVELALAIAAVLALALIVGITRRRIIRPLGHLRAGVARLRGGDLEAQVPVQYPDELGDVAQQFNGMVRSMRQRADAQGRLAAAGGFLAGVAHEVKNPLMAITAAVANLRQIHGLPDDVREGISLIDREARRAAQMTQALLRFVRTDDASADGVCRVAEVVEEALELVAYQFRVDEISVQKHIEDRDGAVHAVRHELAQIVVNLLHNALDALRQTPPPRHLEVRVRRSDGQVEIAVADNGPGLPAPIRDRLFQPFVTTKAGDAVGLGLYTSRRLARAMQGDLRAEDTDHGARFVVALPATEAPPAPPPPQPRPSAPASLEGVEVLLVEDEAPIRSMLRRYLTRLGASVAEAANGQDGLSRCTAAAPDIVITDLRMPGMSGIDFYNEVRARREDLAERFLFLSGDVTELRRSLAAPIDEDRILVKPVELPDLAQKIRRLVDRS